MHTEPLKTIVDLKPKSQTGTHGKKENGSNQRAFGKTTLENSRQTA